MENAHAAGQGDDRHGGLERPEGRHVERRDMRRRAEVLQTIVARIVHAPEATITMASLQELLRVPADAAERILGRLVAGGVLVAVSRGVWASRSWLPVRVGEYGIDARISRSSHAHGTAGSRYR